MEWYKSQAAQSVASIHPLILVLIARSISAEYKIVRKVWIIWLHDNESGRRKAATSEGDFKTFTKSSKMKEFLVSAEFFEYFQLLLEIM